jgi:hypothetical protein
MVCAIGLVGVAARGSAGLHAGWKAEPILKAITSARKIESFLLVNLGSKGLVRDDAEPNIGGYRIEAPAQPLDSSGVSLLARTIRRASRDYCGSPSECLFFPRYAFRFHDAVPALDLLISSDCETWSFKRGTEWLSGFSPYTQCVRDSLRKLVAGAFPDSGRSR